jgi:hypothetical protein
MLNIVDTTQVDKLTPEHIRNLVMLATDAGVALPTNFIDAVYTRMHDDMRTWEEMQTDWPAEFFEVMAWQDRLNCDCNHQ